MGTLGRGRLASFLLGSTADEVVRRAHCPVVTVGHGPDAPRRTNRGRWSFAGPAPTFTWGIYLRAAGAAVGKKDGRSFNRDSENSHPKGTCRMSTKFKSVLFAVLVSAAAGVSVGCESDGSKAPRATTTRPQSPGHDQSAQALTCDKCKVTWVKEPVTTGGGKERVVAYQSRKTIPARTAAGAVDNFFRTGQLQHTCATCGSAMEVCDAH